MLPRVFLVEDDEIYSEFIKKNLRSKYKIHSFINAEDCEVALKSIIPDVLILDYKLPGMSGIDLYEKVKNDIDDKTKIIMLSSIDDGNLVLEFIKKGVRDYVVKDDNVMESLIAVIDGNEDLYYE